MCFSVLFLHASCSPLQKACKLDFISCLRQTVVVCVQSVNFTCGDVLFCIADSSYDSGLGSVQMAASDVQAWGY